MIQNTAYVAESKVAALREEIERLARRAKRLGLVEPLCTLTGAHEDRVYSVSRDGASLDDGGAEADRSPRTWRRAIERFVEVVVSGERPQLPGGWALLGVVEWIETDDGEEAMLRMVPGEEAPSWARTARNRCDHCNVARRRNTVILVRGEDGETRQIGSSCIEDYLPGVSLAALLAGAEIAAFLGDFAGFGDSESGGGGRGGRDFAVVDYLGWVVREVRLTGWVSRTRARESDLTCATADAAYQAMGAYWSPRVKAEDKPEPPTDRDVATAQAIVDLVRERAAETAPEARSDYEHNLYTGVRATCLHARAMGVVASAVVWYERETEKALERARKAARADGYIGEIKGRATFTLTLVRAHTFDGAYGPTTILAFEDPDGRDVVWFASNPPDELERGGTYQIKGTVKKHEINQRTGRKQTVLTRCAVVEKIDAAA